jgi:hypothetical protein
MSLALPVSGDGNINRDAEVRMRPLWTGSGGVSSHRDGASPDPWPREGRYAARAPTPSVTFSQSSTFRSWGATKRCSTPITA